MIRLAKAAPRATAGRVDAPKPFTMLRDGARECACRRIDLSDVADSFVAPAASDLPRTTNHSRPTFASRAMRPA
jgi:hypothetical protein